MKYQPGVSPFATTFWTDSISWFVIRVGVMLTMMVGAWLWTRRWPAQPGSPLVLLGRTSLFVYWVHVELVYGVLTASIHRRLSLPVVFLAFAAFTVAMFGLVRLKTAIVSRGRSTKSMTAAQS